MKNLLYKSVDVMKLSKDNVNNPLSDADMDRVIASLKSLGITHIAISVPMDYAAYATRWCGRVHAAGLKVLHRGTWNAIEGLYNNTKLVGAARPTNAIQYWTDKTRDYIINNPDIFAAGDLWAPLPERTEGIFQDATSFLPPPLPDNYATFFNGLLDVSKQAFVTIGKSVECGFTTNNFTEVRSGWIPQSLFDKAGIICIDHYQQDPSQMYNEIKAVASIHGKKVFLQEWGNYWDTDTAINLANCEVMYDTLTRLADEGVLVGYNDWSGWPGAVESILNGDYTLNAKGKLLASYFISTTPTPTPTPEPTPTPSVILGPEKPYTTGDKTYYRDLTVNGVTVKVRTYHK